MLRIDQDPRVASAEIIIRDHPESDSRPGLLRVVYTDSNMDIDEVDGAGAGPFLARVGNDRSVLDLEPGRVVP